MGSYHIRWCEKHGEWDQDVDHPYDECPECEEAGIAPAQKTKRVIDAARAMMKGWASGGPAAADAAQALQNALDAFDA